MANLKEQKRDFLKFSLENVKLQDVGKERSDMDMPAMTSSYKESKEKIYPDIYLDTKQFPALSNYEVEDNLSLLMEVKVVSHSLNEREGEDSREDYCLKIKKIGIVKKGE